MNGGWGVGIEISWCGRVWESFEQVLGEYWRVLESLGEFGRVWESLGKFWASLGEFGRV